ncbi:MAG TPA: hypothetical protein VGX37_10785 [Allosphingosinicella sp.]|nr:hypothetical protein [Allosphingosinicella sp.]
MDEHDEGRSQRSENREQPELAAPWELEDEESGAESGNHRRDAFTPARKKAFLKVLAKSGCILDACRQVGVSSRTVYNHQESDPEFARHCTLATEMAGTVVELMAWERGVTGVEVDVVRGGKFIGTTLKRSDSILRLLLQGANPKKYGPRPGFTRKRLLAHERKRIEEEIRSRMAVARPTMEEVRDEVISRLRSLRGHRDRQRLEEGWVVTEDGHWIPPGWVRVDGADGRSSNEGGACENDDSV